MCKNIYYKLETYTGSDLDLKWLCCNCNTRQPNYSLAYKLEKNYLRMIFYTKVFQMKKLYLYNAPSTQIFYETSISSCKRISYTSVLTLSSLSRITSKRSESSFAVNTELSLVKPSSHSFFDLEIVTWSDLVISQFK